MRTGLKDKTLWDWLQLLGVLAVPLVVALASILFSVQQTHLADLQHQSDQRIAQQQYDAAQQQERDQQRAAILQTYIDNIQDLLLDHNLLKSLSTDAVAILARARTLTALQRLDPERKGVLVQFIYDARLIGGLDSTRILYYRVIDLFRADLSGASLNDAHLTGAHLNGANLHNAILAHADLDNSTITQQQLDQVSSCYDAYLPKELTCHQNFPTIEDYQV